MEGFGNEAYFQPEPKTQHADIHNKPPPKNTKHAWARFGSTLWDVVKPSDNKQGYNVSDIGKAAADLFSATSGHCKYTGMLKSAEERIYCNCAGCQSWDNEAIIKAHQEEDARLKREKEAEMRREEEEVKRASEPRPAPRGYAPPTLTIPSSSPNMRSQGQSSSDGRPSGPWGPAPKQEQSSSFDFVKATATPGAGGPGTETASAAVDLLGDDEGLDGSAATADLLGGAFDDQQQIEESKAMTDLLMVHAATEDHDDLLAIDAADAPTPTEQLSGVFAEQQPAEEAKPQSAQLDNLLF